MKYFVSLIVFLLLLASCSREPEKIRIGFNTWPGYEAVAIADKESFFKNEGLQVSIQQYASLNDVKQAFADGKIDVMFSTSNEVILLADQGHKLKIVLLADYSNGTDVIIASPDIHSLRDLKGKKVAVIMGSVSNYLLLKALQKVNLTEKDITVVNMDEKEALNQFGADMVSAITTWYPYSAAAINDGGHAIFSSSDIPGQIVDVMSIRQNLIDNSPEKCKQLVAAYLKSLDWLNTNHNEGMKIMSQASEIPVISLEDAMKSLKITTLKDNLTALGTPENKGALYSSTQDFINFLLAKNVIHRSLKAEAIIDPNPIWAYAGLIKLNENKI